METMVTIVLKQQVFELGQALYRTTDPTERMALALQREMILAELKTLAGSSHS